MDITFIGGGNMASAIVGGMHAKSWPMQSISIVEPNAVAAEAIRTRFGVQVYTSAQELPMAKERLVVWAVKPQVLRSVIHGAQGLQKALHLSIVAGVATSSLHAWLGTRRVVRTMPNTAAMVNSGVTGLYAEDASVSEQDRKLVESVVGGIGSFFWVQSDTAMDAVTAVSGSGPAYVFHFLEGLQAAAEGLGFSPDEARRIALLTAEGAVQQALASNDALSLLRERVTSKGGTTAAALNVYAERDLTQITAAAVNAAFARAQQLAVELAAEERA